MSKEWNDNIKVLKTLISEQDEFKRYVLIHMWTNQLFTTTIIDPVQIHENRLKDTSNITTSAEVSSIYDVMRDIRTGLVIKNEQLQQVYSKMLRQANILKVMNHVLELNEDAAVESIYDSCSKIKAAIESNDKYISCIANLSEGKIAAILTDEPTHN